MSQQSHQDSIFNSEKQEATETNLIMDNIGQKSSKFFINKSKWSRSQNHSLNVLSEPAYLRQISLNEQFKQYINSKNDGNLVIVSILGNSSIGKSFLVDSLLSDDKDKPIRIMVHNPQKAVNTNTIDYLNDFGDHVQFFDVKGNTSQQTFLWLYFVSPMIILNLEEEDSSTEEAYLNKFKYVAKKIVLEKSDDLSLPKLLIVRRNCPKNGEADRQQQLFIQKINEVGIFDDPIASIKLPYPPLHENNKPNQIIDLPLQQLNPEFRSSINRINRVVKQTPPKFFKGNPMTSKLFSYMLHPVSSNINYNKDISTGELWKYMMNQYCLDYSTLYKRQYERTLKQKLKENQVLKEQKMANLLSKTKRQVDKKFLPFKNISEQPIYKDTQWKIDEYVKDRENTIINENNQKIFEYNRDRCEKAFFNLNQKNYANAIHSFTGDENKFSEPQYMKSDIMLDNFTLQLENSMNVSGLLDSSDVSSKTLKMAKLEYDLKELDEKIKQENDHQRQEEDSIALILARINNKSAELSQIKNKIKNKGGEEQKENGTENLSNTFDEDIDQILQLMGEKRRKIKEGSAELEDNLTQQRLKLLAYEKMAKRGVTIKQALATGRDSNCVLM